MTNHFDEPKQFEMVVKRDGEIAHWGTREVPPANANPEEKDLGRSFVIADEAWMGCGTYEVSARVVNEPKWATIDFRDLEPEFASDGKFRPVELNVDFSPDEMSMTTTRIDHHFDCEKGRIVTSQTQRE